MLKANKTRRERGRESVVSLSASESVGERERGIPLSSIAKLSQESRIEMSYVTG